MRDAHQPGSERERDTATSVRWNPNGWTVLDEHGEITTATCCGQLLWTADDDRFPTYTCGAPAPIETQHLSRRLDLAVHHYCWGCCPRCQVYEEASRQAGALRCED